MEQPLSGLFGDALVAVLDWTWLRVGPGARAVLERLADTLIPDPPMAIRTLDGHVVSGVLVVDRGQVVAFIGTRQSAPSSFPRWDDGSEGDEGWPHVRHRR